MAYLKNCEEKSEASKIFLTRFKEMDWTLPGRFGTVTSLQNKIRKTILYHIYITKSTFK